MQRSLKALAEQAGRRFVVYGLVDPRDGSVRYVGRTSSSSASPTPENAGVAR